MDKLNEEEKLSQAIANGDTLNSLNAYAQLKKKGYSIQIKEINNNGLKNNEEEKEKKENGK